MQQLEARWAQSFAIGRSCDDGTPPSIPEHKPTYRETLVAEIMTRVRLWRLAFWHTGKTQYCGDKEPRIEAPRVSRVVHRRKWMSA